MKTSYSIAGVVLVVLIGGGIVWYMGQGSGYQQPSIQTQTSGQPPYQTEQTTSSQTVTTSVSVSSSPAAKSFTVNGNDTGADLTTITVPKGTPVTITFGADAAGTYHGGLDFRSSVVSTGPISPGSTKTVSFTANNSFSFTPYWPSTNIAKPYSINIVVQ